MVVNCPCGASLNLKEEHRGRPIGCPECNRRLFPGNDPADKAMITVEPIVQEVPESEEELKLQPDDDAGSGNNKSPNAKGKLARNKNSDILKTILVGGFVVGGILAIGSLILAGLYIWRTTNPAIQTPVASNPNLNHSDTERNNDNIDVGSMDSDRIIENSSATTARNAAPPIVSPVNRNSSNENSPKSNAADNSVTASDPPPKSNKYSLVDLIERIEPSVVRLDVTGEHGREVGSGVFVGDKGYIVTNYHVIQGAKNIKLTTNNGRSSTAIGYLIADPFKDLAIIAPKNNLTSHPITLADKLPRKGTQVAAFGAPLGFSFSTTEGVVSATRSGKEIQEVLKALTDTDVYRLHGYSPNTNWVQTTSAISGGNSGGPLVDMSGKLVGINTWKVPKEQGLNFAADVSEVRSVMKLAENNQIKPLQTLPLKRIRVAFDEGSNQPLAPGEKSAQDSMDDRRSEANGEAKQELEAITKGNEGEQFDLDPDTFVSRSFATNQGTVTGIKVSLDGQFMAANTRSGFVFVFDIVKGQLLYRIETQQELIRAIAFSQNPTRLYTLHDQSEKGANVVVRNADDGTWKTSGLSLNGNSQGGSLAVSDDGRSIFANWQTVRNARFWRFAATGDTFKKFDLDDVFGNTAVNRSPRIPHCSIFTPDGVMLITGFADGWISATSGAGNEMLSINAKQLHVGLVNDIAISCDNKRMASGGEDGQLRLTTLTSRSWSGSAAGDANGEILGVAFSKNCKLVAVTRVNRTIEFYDPERRKLLKTIEVPELCTDLEFMRNDRFIIAGGKDGKIRIIPVPADIIKSD